MFSHLFGEGKFSKFFFAKVLLENQVFEIFFLGQQMTNHRITSLDQSICTDKGDHFHSIHIKIVAKYLEQQKNES